MVRREQEPALGSHGEADDERTLGLGGVEHGERVGRELGLVVGLGCSGRSERPFPRGSNVITRQ